eukprot:m.203965 g.203965  ORF g.203965 m.203965 type:complete len:85 (+) comp39636_c0_seq1:195-449(+)
MATEWLLRRQGETSQLGHHRWPEPEHASTASSPAKKDKQQSHKYEIYKKKLTFGCTLSPDWINSSPAIGYSLHKLSRCSRTNAH